MSRLEKAADDGQRGVVGQVRHELVARGRRVERGDVYFARVGVDDADIRAGGEFGRQGGG